jgi:alkyldihydroxyacetonephosphate synthase
MLAPLVTSPDLSALRQRLPQGAVLESDATFDEVASDWSARSLLHRAGGVGSARPVAVALPLSTEHVVEVLRWASSERVPVVTRGLGSGVSGGAEPVEGCVVLDLGGMERILALDEHSGAVELQAGVRGSDLEAALNPRGLTVGHYPQSIALSSVGGWLAAAGAGQASAGYGEVEDLVMGLTAVLADGTVVRLGRGPRSAAGPDLRRFLVGSEGALAVITEVILSCARLPSGWVWSCWSLPSFEELIELSRQAQRADVGAFVVRGYDVPDAMISFSHVGQPEGNPLLFGFPADVPGVEGRVEALAALAGSIGAVEIEASFGEHWWEHRNDISDTYQRIMGPERSLGPGAVADSMEVASLWRDLPKVYDRVRNVLASRGPLVGCHLSHPYRSGGSLYFSFLLQGEDEYDAERLHTEAWEQSVRAVHEARGTMTHHHGVGSLKAPWMAEELGEGGIEMLRRIKRALDPDGILNPGKLLP